MITPLPSAPLRSMAPAAFIAAADAFMASLPTFVTELNNQASILSASTTTTSSSSVLIGTGAKTFTVAAGLGFAIGQTLMIASTANPANYMLCTVTGYSSTTLNVNCTSIGGSGTLAAWTITLAATAGAGLGANTFTGVQNDAQGADIASAATVNLTTATGNTITITGTTGITAFTLGNGMSRFIKFAGACLLTYNATTMKLNSGGANYTTSAGDVALVYAVAGVIHVTIIRADGQAMIQSATFPATTRMSFNQTAAPTGWTKDVTAALNDSLMRVVTGAVGSGGSNAFVATVNAQVATGSHTLTVSEIPSHTHSVGISQDSGTKMGSSAGTNPMVPTGSITSGAQGGGAGHTHGLTMDVKYNDFIIASKD